MDIIQKLKNNFGIEKKYIDITYDNIDNLLNLNKPLIIYFWAEHCGLCRMLHGLVDELARENQDKVIFGKVNLTNYEKIGTRFQIEHLPTLIFIKNKTETDRRIGNLQKPIIQGWININFEKN